MGVTGDAVEYNNDSKGKGGERNGRGKDKNRLQREKAQNTMKTMREVHNIYTEKALRLCARISACCRLEGVSGHFRARAMYHTIRDDQVRLLRVSPPHLFSSLHNNDRPMADDAPPEIPQVRGLMPKCMR
jgi:hypothetical protein